MHLGWLTRIPVFLLIGSSLLHAQTGEPAAVEEAGARRVVDFGLARPANMMESGEVRANDEVTGVWGTPAYMAPEQWQRRKPSAATDVWGLGMMLFELCSDWLPYDPRRPARTSSCPTRKDPPPGARAAAGCVRRTRLPRRHGHGTGPHAAR